MEGEIGEFQDIAVKKPEQLSGRSLKALETNVKAVIKDFNVEGSENFHKIPQGKNVIIAPTHRTDVDVQLGALVAGKMLPLKISGYSANEKVAALVLGKDNFIPIDSQPVQPIDVDYKGTEYVGEFNPDNFKKMKQAMDEGYALVIAAHNPTFDGKLPDRSAIGPAYLAQISDPQETVIVPIEIGIHSDEPVGRTSRMLNPGNVKDTIKGLFNRPEATVRVGEPLYLEKIDSENLAKFQEIMAKDASQRTQEEADFRRRFMLKLEEIGSPVMEAIARMDPPEKRGKWQSNPPSDGV